jgi:hypothetical protein
LEHIFSGATGTTPIHIKVLSDRRPGSLAALAVVAALPLLLLAPALWNGYALLQYDTGGYLARWYEGYLVVNRSTVYGLFLHLGENSHFWLALGAQALATLWLVGATLRVYDINRPLQVAALVGALCATTALPFLASLLLTDIFAGLSVLSLFLLMVHGRRFGAVHTAALIIFTGFASATHSATLALLIGLCSVALMVRPWLGERLPLRGVLHGWLALGLGTLMLFSANYVIAGKFTWTPGGSSVAFGRMLQDGLVARYLNDHCPQHQYKLCPYRNELPPTADDFLWGDSVFDKLGRFEGLDDEMALIAKRALFAYPLAQASAALHAAATQLVMVATGEGSHNWMAHTWGIFETYLPRELPKLRAARQQQGELDFSYVNLIHVPVALVSMLALAALLLQAWRRRRLDDLDLFAATVATALLGNAFICGALSGPHDRYGARIVWLAVFVVLIAAARHLNGGSKSNSRPA